MGVTGCAATAGSWMASSCEPSGGSVWGLWCDRCCRVLQEEVARTRSILQGAAASSFPMGITRACKLSVH